ncbi:MAG: MarR family winged helix-turn-helix transcriptional regulator [Ignavibacteria bacterium]|jgi:DNA-binding MarR family transcriptional regulator
MKQKQINEIREFNRFYTIIVGLLNKHLLNSRFTLPEARILFELYNNKDMTASNIITSLHLDKGYLSRILRQFEKEKIIVKVKSDNDKRHTYLRLTEQGEKEFQILNEASNKQITGILKQLSPEDCNQLTENMKSIKSILSKIKIQL